MTPASDDDSDRDPYTIPSSSSWFRWDEIGEEERRALPEFFEGSSASRSPRVYKEYRDFIISKYREDPARGLTFTDVRKSLVGDVATLHRVFLALENWGLINFRPPSAEEPPPPLAPPPPEAAGPRVVVEEPHAAVQVVPTAAAAAAAKSSGPVTASASAVGGEHVFRLPPLTSYSDVFGDWAPRRSRVCGRCGEHCASGRYESAKGGFVVCSKCSKNMNDAEEKSADDSNDHAGGSDDAIISAWTDAETLLLLEAVLKHGDDWDLIAQHVRTKSKLDCISRLIQLPFGEHMLGTMSGKFDDRNSANQATDAKAVQHTISEPQQISKTDGYNHADEKVNIAEESSPERPLKRRCFPSLAGATDSLMKQVALLSAVTGPHIAATAAEAALATLCNENPRAEKVFIDEYDASKSSKSDNKEPKSELSVEDQEIEKLNQEEELVLEKNFGATTFQIRAATATALGAAAARAKLLADQEEREIELLMASIIEAQMRKIQYKIRHFEELGFIMKKEYSLIQQIKEALLEEWVTVLQQAFQAGIPRWRDHGFPKSLLDT